MLLVSRGVCNGEKRGLVISVERDLNFGHCAGPYGPIMFQLMVQHVTLQTFQGCLPSRQF